MKSFLNEFKELSVLELLWVNGGYANTSVLMTGYSAYSGLTASLPTHSNVPVGYSATSGWLPGWGPDGDAEPEQVETTQTEPINANPEGVWGGITDADSRDIRMQDEKNLETDEMNGTNDDGSINLLSKQGCKMAGAAQIISQVSGTEVGIRDVNDTYDVNKDGLLTQNEISSALTNAAGENVTVSTDYWEKQLSITNIQESLAAPGTHYVLARAENVVGGDHWIVLEGSFTNDQGQTEFQYNPTSTNDTGRRFILGDSQPGQTNVYTITKVEIYTIN